MNTPYQVGQRVKVLPYEGYPEELGHVVLYFGDQGYAVQIDLQGNRDDFGLRELPSDKVHPV